MMSFDYTQGEVRQPPLTTLVGLDSFLDHLSENNARQIDSAVLSFSRPVPLRALLHGLPVVRLCAPVGVSLLQMSASAIS